MDFKIDIISLKGQFFSKYLKRNVVFRWAAPASYRDSKQPFHVLLMNDGQDYTALNLENTLIKAYSSPKTNPFIYVGLETNQNRMQEYGTASMADFKGRGSKAGFYSKFVVEEFVPFLKREFKVSHEPAHWVFCGMSLGGLSAFDIVYNHPKLFSKVGVFSGSFWWRKKPYVKKDLADRSRIILDVIKNRPMSPNLQFWLQCGTLDETADRNENGIIDAIDDTLDVIKELQKKGYSHPGNITYVEVDGGKHDLPTWSTVFPQFLEWAFAKKEVTASGKPISSLTDTR